MKIETYLAKFYGVCDGTPSDAATGEQWIAIYEKGEDCEPIGFFVTFDGVDCYQYRNIYGKVASGTGYTAKTLKSAAKAGLFY